MIVKLSSYLTAK